MRYFAWTDGLFIVAGNLRDAQMKAYKWLKTDPEWGERSVPSFDRWKGKQDVIELTKSERNGIYFQIGG